jgi:FkbM family methyltransferase
LETYHTRSYEAADLREVVNLVKPGDVCVDAGANIGVYALNLARAVGDRGRAIAFEPLRRNALALGLAAELNGFCNISVETTVVSNRSGKEVIAISPTVEAR